MHAIRVLELFCGIGGCAAALGSRADVVAAVDINQRAVRVYLANFSHPARVAAIESFPASLWSAWSADLWWMSPPCQPFTARGRQRDMHDPRFAFWRGLLQRLEEVRPRYVALENVPPFLESQAFAELVHQLERAGYQWTAWELCPTELGIPNRRRRCYVLASLGPLRPRPHLAATPKLLCEFLDTECSAEVFVSPELLAAHGQAMHVVDAEDDHAVAACFTAAYGRSVIRSGSYLRTPLGIRRFAPAEIARLLGFGDHFTFPPDLSLRQQWRLLGNSLSIPAVRWVLGSVF